MGRHRIMVKKTVSRQNDGQKEQCSERMRTTTVGRQNDGKKNSGQTQNDGQKNSGQYADTCRRKTRKLINTVQYLHEGNLGERLNSHNCTQVNTI